MEGYIALHRKITQNEFYFSQKFTWTQAWIDLLLIATHAEKTVIIRNTVIKLQPGDSCYSQLSLAERWKWDVKTVKKYLKMLENKKMVETQTNNVTTIVSITNWQNYQVSRNQTVKKSTDNGEQNGEQKETKTDTNNNGNNVNNIFNCNSNKNKIKNNEIEILTSDDQKTENKIFQTNSNIIPPKLEWVIERSFEMDYENIETESEKFFNYYESNGWMVGKNQMRNWHSALSNWNKNSETFRKPKNKNNVKGKSSNEPKSERISRNLKSAGELLANINSF